jgi:hypothetical protein
MVKSRIVILTLLYHHESTDRKRVLRESRGDIQSDSKRIGCFNPQSNTKKRAYLKNCVLWDVTPCGSCIPEDTILHSHRHGNLKFYKGIFNLGPQEHVKELYVRKLPASGKWRRVGLIINEVSVERVASRWKESTS